MSDESNNIRPDYYKRGGLEAIEVINRWGLNYNLGALVKYMCRAGVKPIAGKTPREAAIEDLRKARTHLDFEIKRLLEEEEA